MNSEKNISNTNFDFSYHQSLMEAFGPLIKKIQETSILREELHQMPRSEVRQLLELGFGALRVPKCYGGYGASNVSLFKLIEALAEADPNIAQIFRSHFAFVEGRLGSQNQQMLDKWLPVIGGGALVGSAMAEDVIKESLTIDRSGEHLTLTGEKKYCTGSIFADWLYVSVLDNSIPTGYMVPSPSAGITLMDDWSGFGQKQSGSGTTIFESVIVEEDNVVYRHPGYVVPNFAAAFYQLVLIAIMSGISKAILRDTVKYVQEKLYNVGTNGKIKPRYDPLVQRIVGRISSISFTIESVVENCSRLIDEAAASHHTPTKFEQLCTEVSVKVFQSQPVAGDLVLESSTLMFEVGGASATHSKYMFDRHWRNARTIASHNPAIYKECSVGNFFLNGISPLKFSYPSSLMDV